MASAARLPPRPSRAPPPMTRRSPTWFADSLVTEIPGRATSCRAARGKAPLRREPAPGSCPLSDRRAAPRHRHRPPGAGQGAVLQQHQRHRRGLRAGGGIRPGKDRRGGHRQARQSLRRRRRAEPRRSLSPGAPLRSGLGLRRRGGAQPAARCRGCRGNRQDLHRGDHRSRRRRSGQSRPWRRRRTSGCCSPAALPDPRAAGMHGPHRRRRPACPGSRCRQ